MKTLNHYHCSCGKAFSAPTESQDPSAPCPRCGRILSDPVWRKNIYPEDDPDVVIRATFEVLGQHGVIFSGAR